MATPIFRGAHGNLYYRADPVQVCHCCKAIKPETGTLVFTDNDGTDQVVTGAVAAEFYAYLKLTLGVPR